MRVRAQFTTSRKQLREFFKLWDKNGNGVIEVDEVKLALDDIGLNLTMDECQALVDRFDNNGIPAIQYDDLVDLLCGGNELQSFTASRRATQFITEPGVALNEMRFDENLTGKVISWAGRQTRRPQNIQDLSSTPGTTVYGASCGLSESAVFHDYSRRAAAFDAGAVVVGEIGQRNSRDALEKLKQKTIKRFQTTGRNHLAVGTAPTWFQAHGDGTSITPSLAATFDQKQAELQWLQSSALSAQVSASAIPDSPASSNDGRLSSYRSYGDGDFKDLVLRLRETQRRGQARINKHFMPKGHLGKDFGRQENTLANTMKHEQRQAQTNLGLHRSVLYEGLPLVTSEVMRQEHESSHALRVAPDSGMDFEGLGGDVRWKTTSQLFASGRALPEQEFDKAAELQKIRLAKDAIDQYEAVLAERERERREWDAVEKAQRLRMAAKASTMMEEAAAKRRRDDLWEHQIRKDPNVVHSNPAQRSHADAFGFGFLPGTR